MDKETTHNDDKKEIKKIDKSTQTASTSQSIESENFLDVSPESITDISIKVSSLGSTTASASQSNPPIQNQPEIVLKRRRALEDRRQRCGEPCFFVLNNNDLKNLEQALKCRLITRVEYHCLKLQREHVEKEAILYTIQQILQILANEEKDATPTPSTSKSRKN